MITSIKTAFRLALPKNVFARGVAMLAGGSASAQLIALASAPLLARLYSPEEFGLYAVFTSLLAIISVIVSLRYELAILLPEDDVEAANIAVLSLLLVTVVTVLSGVLVAFLGAPIAKSLGLPTLYDFLWLLPVGVLLSGFYSVFNYWATREKRFSSIAVVNMRQMLATTVIQLAGFKLGLGALLLGLVTGQSVGTTSLARPFLAKTILRQVTWAGIWQAALRYRRFPIFLTWDGLLNTASSQLPQLLFASFFSPLAAGLYSLANKVLALPSSVLGNAIGQVFFSHSAEACRTNQHGKLVEDFQSKLINIGMPPTIIVVLIAPDIFALIFGEKWRQAGEFSRWMAPWLFLNFVYYPISVLIAVMERQRQALTLQIILLISRSMAIGLGVWIGDALVAIAFFSLASAICYFGFIVWIGLMAGNSPSNLIRSLLTSCGLTVAATSPIIVAIIFFKFEPSMLIVCIAITTLMLIGYYWKLLSKAY